MLRDPNGMDISDSSSSSNTTTISNNNNNHNNHNNNNSSSSSSSRAQGVPFSVVSKRGDNIIVVRDQYELVRTLRKTLFGKAKLGFDTKAQLPVAIKVAIAKRIQHVAALRSWDVRIFTIHFFLR